MDNMFEVNGLNASIRSPLYTNEDAEEAARTTVVVDDFSWDEGPTLTFLRDEILGYKVGNILMVTGFFFLLFFLLTLCWNCCSKSNTEESYPLNGQGENMVIAREIKPGFYVVSGSDENAFRVIQEYDAAYNALAASAGGTRGGANRPPSSNGRGYESIAPNCDRVLIDGQYVDLNDRPPPYAPTR